MIGWIIVIVYVIGWVFSARIAWLLFEDDVKGEDAAGLALFSVLAGLIALLWPLFLPCYLVGRAGKRYVDRQRSEEQREHECA